ncbi:putative Heavy-metal-associated domain (N-terminus) and membrane-bounded cytochrome biogenesis cycZ-like domain, membrane copper tolerance protein [Rubrivivax sp. A210]|uniref:urease accessory protein UreH domain-containing protein n=1 Tax=Rubrivivax sp. A210 TaxID=2772301 RepID=UPI00191A8018|nr:sulfite exporter TauE/SafE family protein [Rubrivivax sp. A210]CAD5365890.1 putative Heavy-metal-associated domain (N-terminus) and membrane-bounded cytochrome biogenesis cycZ-like domain, membrane copper tolerance protein [Rubrivivax sp. A210]
MDAALIASAGLLGLAGTPHCAAMCAAPCAAVVGRGPRSALWAFHLARIASYALGGAVAAASVGALAWLSGLSPALRPLWALLHAAALALGLWLLFTGRQPAWLGRIGRAPASADANGWQPLNGPRRGPMKAAAGGGLWVLWPCGLLQSALLVASMANHAAAGAAAMAVFAVASSAGLLAAPWAWQRMLAGGGAAAREKLAVRAAGALLLAGSGWALGRGLWHQVAAYCATL